MKVVIIGGSGLIGTKVAALLRAAGHEVLAASPSSGVNSVTGEGLGAALAGAQAVIDVTNSPSFADDDVMRFFQSSTGNLLAAGKKAGVRHHIALSIVGTDRNPDSGYLRAKAAQEALIRGGGVPYTILRATQFFEFIRGIAQAGMRDGRIHLTGATLQPIAAEDVAAALADVASREPVNTFIDVAGPQAIPLADLARRVLESDNDPREIVTDDEARYFGARLTDASLTPAGKHVTGHTTLEAWLSATK